MLWLLFIHYFYFNITSVATPLIVAHAHWSGTHLGLRACALPPSAGGSVVVVLLLLLCVCGGASLSLRSSYGFFYFFLFAATTRSGLLPKGWLGWIEEEEKEGAGRRWWWWRIGRTAAAAVISSDGPNFIQKVRERKKISLFTLWSAHPLRPSGADAVMLMLWCCNATCALSFGKAVQCI